MRMFKYENGREEPIYETFEELLNEDIVFLSEDVGFYYVRLNPTWEYDNDMWKVDKKNGKVSCIHFTDYIVNASDNATELDPKTFKLQRAS